MDVEIHFSFQGHSYYIWKISCKERHGIFQNLGQKLCFPFHFYLHNSTHPWIFIYLHPCLHRLSNCYIYAQIHGSSDSSIHKSTSPWILISLYLYNHRSTDLMVSTKSHQKSPPNLLLFGPQICNIRQGLAHDISPWIWYLTTQDCSKTAHCLQMKPAPFAQIFIYLPPQIYGSSDLYISTSIDPQIPNICRSSDPSF